MSERTVHFEGFKVPEALEDVKYVAIMRRKPRDIAPMSRNNWGEEVDRIHWTKRYDDDYVRAESQLADIAPDAHTSTILRLNANDPGAAEFLAMGQCFNDEKEAVAHIKGKNPALAIAPGLTVEKTISNMYSVPYGYRSVISCAKRAIQENLQGSPKSLNIEHMQTFLHPEATIFSATSTQVLYDHFSNLATHIHDRVKGNEYICMIDATEFKSVKRKANNVQTKRVPHNTGFTLLRITKTKPTSKSKPRMSYERSLKSKVSWPLGEIAALVQQPLELMIAAVNRYHPDVTKIPGVFHARNKKEVMEHGKKLSKGVYGQPLMATTTASGSSERFTLGQTTPFYNDYPRSTIYSAKPLPMNQHTFLNHQSPFSYGLHATAHLSNRTSATQLERNTLANMDRISKGLCDMYMQFYNMTIPSPFDTTIQVRVTDVLWAKDLPGAKRFHAAYSRYCRRIEQTKDSKAYMSPGKTGYIQGIKFRNEVADMNLHKSITDQMRNNRNNNKSCTSKWTLTTGQSRGEYNLHHPTSVETFTAKEQTHALVSVPYSNIIAKSGYPNLQRLIEGVARIYRVSYTYNTPRLIP